MPSRTIFKYNQLLDTVPFNGAGDTGKVPAWNGSALVPTTVSGVGGPFAALSGATFTGPVVIPDLLVGVGGLDLDGNSITGLSSLTFNTDARLEIGAVGVFGVYDSGSVGRLLINTEEQEIDLAYDTHITGNLYVTGTIPSSRLTGLLPSAVIPPLAISQPFPVANQAAMLALIAQRGDVAIRADNSKSYILSTDNPGTLVDWLELTSPGAVTAWNGLTGNIVATTANLPESGDSLYYTAARAALKAPIANATFTGTTAVDVLNVGGVFTAIVGGRLANFTFDSPFGASFAVAYHHSLADVLNYAILQDNLGNTRLNGASAAIYVGNASRVLVDASSTYFFGSDTNLQATLKTGSRATLGNAYHFTLDVAGIVNAGDYLIGQDSATPQVELVGDSLTLGWLATHPYDFYVTLPTYNGIAFNKTNLGVNSRTLKDAIRGAYTDINPLYANKSGMNAIVCWLGTNDIILDGDTPSQAFSTQQEFGRRQRAKGYKFIVATMISRNGADAAKNTFNALIRAHWAEFADGIADLAANVNLGADGAYANATYFNADGIHLTDAGQALVGAIVQAALIEVITNSANKTFNGTVSAPLFSGSGASLTGIPESGVTSLVADLAAKAPLASPTHTGITTDANLAVTGDIAHAGNKVDKVVAITDSATTTFDLALGDMGVWTIGGNRTFAVSNGHSGSFVVKIIQDGTGTRIPTWPATFKFSGGSTLSTVAGAVDILAFVSLDGGTSYQATLTTGHA